MAPLPSLHDAPPVHWQIWLADARGLGFAQAANLKGGALAACDLPRWQITPDGTIPARGQRQPGGTAPGGCAGCTMAGI